MTNSPKPTLGNLAYLDNAIVRLEAAIRTLTIADRQLLKISPDYDELGRDVSGLQATLKNLHNMRKELETSVGI